MISRDQMVGPWQVPVADVAVTHRGLFRPHAARPWPWASARRWRCSMRRPRGAWRWPRRSPTFSRPTSARSSNVRLSANWMAACGEPGEDAALYATVHAVGEELCPALGIAIPVGKDSLSMKTAWGEGAATQVRRRAGVADRVGVRAGRRRAQDLTPQLRTDLGATALAAGRPGRRREPARRLLPGAGARRARRDAAGSRRSRDCSTDLAAALAELRAQTWCSPITTAPTAACSRRWSRWPSPATAGSTSNYPPAPTAPLARCSARSWAWCCRSGRARWHARSAVLAQHGLGALTHALGAPTREMRVRIEAATGRVDESWEDLRRAWSETSCRMRELRDDPGCAREEFAARLRRRRARAERGADLRSERRHLPRRTSNTARAARRGAARAGREQPGGDGARCWNARASSRTTCT